MIKKFLQVAFSKQKYECKCMNPRKYQNKMRTIYYNYVYQCLFIYRRKSKTFYRLSIHKKNKTNGENHLCITDTKR